MSLYDISQAIQYGNPWFFLGELFGLAIVVYLSYKLLKWLWKIIINLWKDILGLKK